MDIDIHIPQQIATDRPIRALITQWRNLHLRHRECRKRLPWRTKKVSELEKKRRKEKWQIVARVLDIERQILIWCAKTTHHPEIWSSKNGKKLSTLQTLRIAYDANRKRANALLKTDHALRMRLRAKRIAIVAEMRRIIRRWMIAVLTAVYPHTNHIPNPLPLHPAELRPRKIKVAAQKLLQEVA
jgi:hypothetical protein